LIEWELVVVQMLAGPGGVAVGNKANGVIGVCSVGGVDGGNKANGVSDAVGVGGGDTTNGGVGAGKASFVPKTNSSIAARVVCASRYSCQRSHDFLKQLAVLFPRI
jgi:hypothetical protein